MFCNAESRRLEIRHGLKKSTDERKQYVHMLNGTLCATERALCCLVENYQTPDVRFWQFVIALVITPLSPRDWLFLSHCGHTCKAVISYLG